MKKITAVLIFIIVLTNTYGQTTITEWFARGNEHFSNGDYASAITAFSEAINLGTTNIDAWWFRGFSYYQVRNYDAAIADYNTVINRMPDFPVAYIVRGDAYGAKGIYHKAIADYRIGFEKGFDLSSGYNVDKTSNADMWFCGALYMEIVINRFLGNSDAVTRNENWLRTVIDNNNVTRAEVEAFYRNGIRGIISDTVDEEFNRVSFLLEGSPNGSYNAILTRNPQTGQYILSYEGYFDRIRQTKTLSASSLDALSSAMRNNTADFNQATVNAVQAQARLIPAVALSDAALNEVKTIMTNFFISPNADTFNAVREVYSLYTNARLETGRAIYEQARLNCIAILTGFNEGLARRVVDDTARNSSIRILTTAQQQRLRQLR